MSEEEGNIHCWLCQLTSSPICCVAIKKREDTYQGFIVLAWAHCNLDWNTGIIHLFYLKQNDLIVYLGNLVFLLCLLVIIKLIRPRFFYFFKT
jgi:hypothetical protein